MTQMLHILEQFAKEIEKSNPYHLVLKGGTALSLYYLERHRESEDLDFDAPKHLKTHVKRIETFFADILSKLKDKNIIQDYRITKAELASTERYHLKLELTTHKRFMSKIDIDFVELPPKLLTRGKLYLYPVERIFVTKAVTFVSRKEFKDLYDIVYLLKKVDINKYKKKNNVQKLLQDVIQILQHEDVISMYKAAFRNVDLRFKDVKPTRIDMFVDDAIKKLRIAVNQLGR